MEEAFAVKSRGLSINYSNIHLLRKVYNVPSP